MEFLAHLSGDQWAKIPTRLERFQILKELEDEVRRLHRTYVLRKTEKSGSTVVEPSAPEGYESSRDYNLIGIVDSVFVPGYYADFLDLVSALMRRRARLRRYAAHRVGRPGDRYQNLDEWKSWSTGSPPSHACGIERELARDYFREGRDYEFTLWEIAHQWMMSNGQLDRRHAVSIKKSVDRAHIDILGEKAPPAPRGWWRPATDLGTSRGGLQETGLAWVPSIRTDSQSHVQAIPYHIRFEWMRAFSSWSEDAKKSTGSLFDKD